MNNPLDRLTDEFAAKRLRLYADALDAQPGCSCDNCDQCFARNLTSAEAEMIAGVIEALENNARRYVWLRENSATDSDSGIHVSEPEQDFCEKTLGGKELDVAIDYELARIEVARRKGMLIA